MANEAFENDTRAYVIEAAAPGCSTGRPLRVHPRPVPAADPGPWLLSCGCMAYADGTRKACTFHERITIEIKANGLVYAAAKRRKR